MKWNNKRRAHNECVQTNTHTNIVTRLHIQSKTITQKHTKDCSLQWNKNYSYSHSYLARRFVIRHTHSPKHTHTHTMYNNDNTIVIIPAFDAMYVKCIHVKLYACFYVQARVRIWEVEEQRGCFCVFGLCYPKPLNGRYITFISSLSLSLPCPTVLRLLLLLLLFQMYGK